MSATLDANLFANYFSQRGTVTVPTVTMPGRAFPVAALFLEDALELVGHCVRPGADWARRGGGKGGKGGKVPIYILIYIYIDLIIHIHT